MSSNPERSNESDQAAAAATAAVEQVEGEIRAFVRRDVSAFRRPRTEAGEPADSLNSAIERVSGASVAEIERVITELTRVRDMLRTEGERVQREVAGYASLSQAAMTSMKIIADSVTQWKSQSPPATTAVQGRSLSAVEKDRRRAGGGPLARTHHQQRQAITRLSPGREGVVNYRCPSCELPGRFH